jgi:hypothetical protein
MLAERPRRQPAAFLECGRIDLAERRMTTALVIEQFDVSSNAIFASL